MFNYPRLEKLAMLPTPIHAMERLSNLFGGPRLFVKRDDLTGCELTGNKVRKLEFLLAEARDQGAQVVITCGGAQSNHARATAIAAVRCGMRAHLLLRSDGVAALDGNLLLDRLVDAEITFVTPEEYETIDDRMEELADEYRRNGKMAYVIPEGGSNELGSMGYVLAMQEIHQQLQELKLRIDVLVCTVGSGGTYAGLVLGKYLFGAPFEVWGINICDTADYFVQTIRGILKKARKRFDLPEEAESVEIKIIDGYVGKGYGLSRLEEIDTIKTVACTEGIILDPVYTGKTMYGLRDLISQGRLRKDQNVLFLHSGGIFGLFPKRNLFF